MIYNNIGSCFVQIEEDGEAAYGAWEDCAEGCPGMPTTTQEATTGTTETVTPGNTGQSYSFFGHSVLFIICFNIFVVIASVRTEEADQATCVIEEQLVLHRGSMGLGRVPQL